MKDKPTKWTKEAIEAALQACCEKSLAEQQNTLLATPIVSLEKLGQHMGVSREFARQLLIKYGIPTDLKAQSAKAQALVLKSYAHLHTLTELYDINQAKFRNVESLRAFMMKHGITYKDKGLQTNSLTHQIRQLDFDTAKLSPKQILDKAGIKLRNPADSVGAAGIAYRHGCVGRLPRDKNEK